MRTVRVLLLALALLPLAAVAQDTGTAFSFQGRLHDGAVAATGPVLLRITPWDGETGGTTLAPPLETGPLELVDGVFTTELDFGPAVFLGEPVWLEIEIDSDGGGYVPMAPRQAVAPTPYAMHAQTVAVDSIDEFALQDGAVSAAKIAPGAIGASQVDATQVQRRIAPACGAGMAIAAVAEDGSTSCVATAGDDGDWQVGGGEVYTDQRVRIGAAAPGATAPLMLDSKGQYAPEIGNGRGDFHIGNDAVGLSFGVATGGGGTGAARIWTKGGFVSQLYLGSAEFGTVIGIKDDQVGVGLTNPAATLDVDGSVRVRALAGIGVPARRDVQVEPDGDIVAAGERWIAIPGSGFLAATEMVQYIRDFDGMSVDAGQYTLLMLPVSLPDGARITQARLHAIDNSPSFDYLFYLIGIPHTGATSQFAMPIATAGSDPAVRSFQSPEGFSLLVDNGSHSYAAVLFPESGSWQGDASLIRSVSLRLE